MNINNLDNNQSLGIQAYTIIRNMIVLGELDEGNVISISAMAKFLNMSRTPITHAFQRLESEKFVTIVPKHGVLINSITIDEAREMHELRAAIETYSAKRSFENFNPYDIDVLKQSLIIQKKTVDNNDPKAFMTEDIIFHKYLLSKYKNTNFLSILDTLYDRVFLIGVKNCSINSRLIDSFNEHNNIVDSLEKHDKNSFIDSTENHILNGFISLTGNYRI